MIKRYNPEVGGYEGIEFFGMKEASDGRWVSYDDYISEIKKVVLQMREGVEDHFDCFPCGLDEYILTERGL